MSLGYVQLWLSLKDIARPQSPPVLRDRPDSNCHLYFCQFPAKARVMKAIRKDDIFLLLSTMRFRSYSFGQSLAAPIKLATSTLPSENSPPQCPTNAVNILDADHRFQRI
jgi:hypothetical protein